MTKHNSNFPLPLQKNHSLPNKTKGSRGLAPLSKTLRVFWPGGQRLRVNAFSQNAKCALRGFGGSAPKVLSFLLAAMLLVLTPLNAAAAPSVSVLTYTYHDYGDRNFPILSPPAYNYWGSLYAKDFGLPDNGFYNIACFFASDDYLFIGTDTSIVMADHEFQTKEIFTSVVVDGNEQALTSISDIFVTPEGEVYACEPDKNRILHYNSDMTLKRVITEPEGIVMTVKVPFVPFRCVVDRFNRIYVIARNIYEGIVEINPDGTFSKYFGVNKVRYSATQLFWRQLQTEEQRARSSLWLPTEFSHMAIDSHGFLYTTVVEGNSATPIRKLNAKGADILRFPRKTAADTFYRPKGDWMFNIGSSENVPTGASQLTSVTINDYGVYAVLDTKRSRIFVYDDDGYLLYAIGEQGNTMGKFQLPIAIQFMDDKLLVIDKGNASIEVFQRNEFGDAIHKAVEMQYHMDYNGAAEYWRQTLEFNFRYQYAYIGIGKSLYRQGNYEEAMKYFEEGADANYYSMAFDKVRQQWLENNFMTILLVIAGLVVLRIVYTRVLKPRRNKKNAIAGGEAIE